MKPLFLHEKNHSFDSISLNSKLPICDRKLPKFLNPSLDLPIVLFPKPQKSDYWTQIAFNILRSVHSESSFLRRSSFLLKKKSTLGSINENWLLNSIQEEKTPSIQPKPITKDPISDQKGFLSDRFVYKECFQKKKPMIIRKKRSFEDDKEEEEEEEELSQALNLKNPTFRRKSCYGELFGVPTPFELRISHCRSRKDYKNASKLPLFQIKIRQFSRQSLRKASSPHHSKNQKSLPMKSLMKLPFNSSRQSYTFFELENVGNYELNSKPAYITEKKSQSSFLRPEKHKALSFLANQRKNRVDSLLIQPITARSLKDISSKVENRGESSKKELSKPFTKKKISIKSNKLNGNHSHSRSLGERLVSESLSLSIKNYKGVNEGYLTTIDDYQLVQKNTRKLIKGILPKVIVKNEDVYRKSNKTSYLMIKKLKGKLANL